MPHVYLFPILDESSPDKFSFFYNDVEILRSFITINVDENSGACVDGNEDCTEQTTYFWSHRFRPNKEVKITLQYKLATWGDLGRIDDAEDDNDYCITDDFLPALKKRNSDGYNLGYDEYLEFSPANALGKIGNLRLAVDKGKADNWVSFWGNNVKKFQRCNLKCEKPILLHPRLLWFVGRQDFQSKITKIN